MNELDQKLLAIIQDGFPLVERPYKALAETLNVSEQKVFDAVEMLRVSGVIRRIGGVYDSKKLGFISRLCAGIVPASSLDFSAEPHEQTAMEKFAAAVNEVPAITHNYIRSHEYNVWFTVIAENEAAIETVVERVCAKTKLHDVHALSATKKYKINTVMSLDERRGSAGSPTLTKDEIGESAPALRHSEIQVPRHSETCALRHSDNRRLEESSNFLGKLTDSDKFRIHIACDDIPHSLTPFKDWGVSCDKLREDLASKRMRRFGAILRHQNAGYAFNAMVCFRVVDSRKSEVGSDERGSRCGTAAAPVVSKQWLVNRVNDERRVILSDEAAKDPVKSYDLIAQAGSLLASNPHISHCYERPSFDGFPYNVYAMMHANSAEQLDQFIADCVNALNALQSSPVDYVVLRSVRELKKTSFKFFA